MDIRFHPHVRERVKEGREVSRDDWLSLTGDNQLTSLDTFRRRLNRALGDLGRVDINIKTALDKLSTDLSRNEAEGLPTDLSAASLFLSFAQTKRRLQIQRLEKCRYS